MLWIIILFGVISAETIYLDKIETTNHHLLENTTVYLKCNNSVYYSDWYCKKSMLCGEKIELKYCDKLLCNYSLFSNHANNKYNLINTRLVVFKKYNISCDRRFDLNFFVIVPKIPTLPRIPTMQSSKSVNLYFNIMNFVILIIKFIIL